MVERAAKAEAKAELLQEMLDKGMTPKAAEAAVEAKEGADPEPQRKDFPDDAQYNRALGRWDARQETKAALAERDKSADNSAALEQLQAEMQAAQASPGDVRKEFRQAVTGKEQKSETKGKRKVYNPATGKIEEQ